MNCLQFRRLKLTDPCQPNQEADAHRDSCPVCSAFEKEILILEENVRSALTVAPPEGFAARILLNQSLKHPRRPTRWYWISTAASFFIATLAFLFVTGESLDAQVIGHMEHEANWIHAQSDEISTDEVRSVLRSVGGDTNVPFDSVTFASKCPMGERWIAHFVIVEDDVPYTVILVPDEIHARIPVTQVFRSDLWQGIIKPHALGNLVVVMAARQSTSYSRTTNTIAHLANRYAKSIEPMVI